ncbi:hypothetical protein LCGC14_1836370 [marine sediment metagenome]|uniref:Uncharacterized protein n=1 Tax=marine sediment metagenome TaxID=412755 RepID=A0A0F9GEU1_9ZZZZ
MSGKEMRTLIESIMIEDSNDADRLSEIRDQIKELMGEAKSLLHNSDDKVWNRARSYWYPHIIMALDSEHEFLGGSMVTMQDTIDEMAGTGNIEDAVTFVDSLMNEEGMSIEDAVNEISSSMNINPNELMAAVLKARKSYHPKF